MRLTGVQRRWRMGRARSRIIDARNMLLPLAMDEAATPGLRAYWSTMCQHLDEIAVGLDEPLFQRRPTTQHARESRRGG